MLPCHGALEVQEESEGERVKNEITLTVRQASTAINALHRAADWSEPIDPMGVRDVEREKASIIEFRTLIKYLNRKLSRLDKTKVPA